MRKDIDALDVLEKRCASTDLKDVEAEIAFLQRDLGAKQDFIREYTPRIQGLNASIASRERTKKVVQDNLSLRETIRERGVQEEQLAALNERLGGGARHLQDCQRSQQRHEQEKQKLVTERATLSGRLQELSQQASSLQTQLNSASYR